MAESKLKLSIGDRIGRRYKVLGMLGEGAFGCVYRVHDADFDVERAMKLVAPPHGGTEQELEDFHVRFRREAQTIAKLHDPVRHPNIITVIDIGEVEGWPWFTMEHFPGTPLDRWFKPLKSADRALHVMKQLASAVAHAHARGVKHRDIKLGNALVSESLGDLVMLIDFGIAKADHHEALTMTGGMSGTEAYMAPEYIRGGYLGTAMHTEQTDLWALGCVFYAVLTGTRAFTQDLNYQERIMKGKFTPVLQARSNLDDTFALVVTDLLRVDPADRIKTAVELQRRLAEVTRTIDPSKPVPQVTPPSSGAIPKSVERENFKLIRADGSTSQHVAPSTPSVTAKAPLIASPSLDDDPFAAAKKSSNSVSLSVPLMNLGDDDGSDLFGTAMPPSRSVPRPAPRESSEDASTPATDGQTFLRAISTDLLPVGERVPADVGAPVARDTTETEAVDERSLTKVGPPVFAPVKVNNNKASIQARRTFVLVGISVVGIFGIGLAYNLADFRTERAPEAAYVDPTTVKADRDGRAEAAAIERRQKEQADEAAKNAMAMAEMQARQQAAAAALGAVPPPAESAPPSQPAPAPPTRSVGGASSPAVIAAAPPPGPVSRYGVRASGNTASVTSAASSAPAAPAAAGAVKGIRIPVKLKAAATSAPGPVIAVVTQETQVGTLRIPAGTEIHGASSGASGPRLNINFSNAIMLGRNVMIRGSAFGADQRGGIPGSRSAGNGSETASKVAGSVVSSGTALVADAVGLDPVADALRAAGGSANNKTSRINNEEDLLTVAANVRFYVYVESIQ